MRNLDTNSVCEGFCLLPATAHCWIELTDHPHLHSGIYGPLQRLGGGYAGENPDGKNVRGNFVSNISPYY